MFHCNGGLGHPNAVISSLLCLVVCVVQDADAHTLTKHAMGQEIQFHIIGGSVTLAPWGSGGAVQRLCRVPIIQQSTGVVVPCLVVRTHYLLLHQLQAFVAHFSTDHDPELVV